MSQWLRTGFIWLLLVPFVGQSSNAAELTSALDLVTNDVAFCLEVPQLQENWDRLESGPVMARLRAFPPFQRLLESPGFRHWQLVEEHDAHQGFRPSFGPYLQNRLFWRFMFHRLANREEFCSAKRRMPRRFRPRWRRGQDWNLAVS